VSEFNVTFHFKQSDGRLTTGFSCLDNYDNAKWLAIANIAAVHTVGTSRSRADSNELGSS